MANPLDEQWRDLAQAMTLAAEDEQSHPAAPMVERMMALATAERLGVALREQVKALRWAAAQLGEGTTAGAAVNRWADGFEKGQVVL